MTARTRWIALLVLLGIWGAVGVWVFTQSSAPRRVPLTHVSGQKAKRESSRGKSGSDLKIQLELLAASRLRTEKALGSPKNIFAPVFPGQAGFAIPNSTTTSDVAPLPQQTPEELAMAAGRQELAQFRYLGYLSRGGRDEAFLAKGNALHIAKTGDTIEQRILVKAINPSGVTLQETSSKAEQRVSLAPDVSNAMMPPPAFPGNMGGPSFPGPPGNVGGPQPFVPGIPPSPPLPGPRP